MRRARARTAAATATFNPVLWSIATLAAAAIVYLACLI
jgi:hypothetical protein